MSTIALTKLLDYILSLSLSNNNKDWLAGKIIESKTRTKEEERVSASDFYGIWNDDGYSCQEMIDDIKESRTFTKELVEL